MNPTTDDKIQHNASGFVWLHDGVQQNLKPRLVSSKEDARIHMIITGELIGSSEVLLLKHHRTEKNGNIATVDFIEITHPV